MEQPETLTIGRPVRQARTASHDALRQLFDASYRRLVVQLYGVVGDAAEAEDLVQEAFVRASAAGQRFLRTDNPEAWLRTTAINLHRNRWRKVRNFGVVRSRLAAPEDLPGLDDHLIVMEAMRKLPAIHREVLALHYLADLDVAAIALTLGVAEGTVKSRLARGRDALAALLTEGDDDV